MKHTNNLVTRTLYILLLAIILAEVLIFTAWTIRDTRDYKLSITPDETVPECVMPSPFE